MFLRGIVHIFLKKHEGANCGKNDIKAAPYYLIIVLSSLVLAWIKDKIIFLLLLFFYLSTEIKATVVKLIFSVLLQAYRSPDSHLVRLFCCGFYEEIVIMDPITLSLVYTLSSRINPDWISALHVLR